MTEIKLLSDSEVEIVGEVPADDFMFEKPIAVEEIARSLDIKGFRKGKVPESVILKNINHQTLLERMAIMALEKKYQDILKKHKIKSIGRPEIIITKMAENNPLGFKIKTSVIPEINLPDYKNIAREIIKEQKKAADISNEEREKIRINILDKILSLIILTVPRVLIESEKDKMLSEMKSKIIGMGLRWLDYLKHIKKTEVELKTSWEENAVKRVKYGLALYEMAEREGIKVSDGELNEEMKKITQSQGELKDNERQEKLKQYIYGVVRNEKLFKLFDI